MSADVQPFEAEVGRVLDLVINSLYQHREIFLRELISNASDACDRLRYASLTEPALLGDDPTLKILITPDRAAGVLTITDNGIGMSRDELADNLGTIARSGTQGFMRQLSGDAAKDVHLIGQFGVGFYSAFMVATEVLVVSRRAGEEHSWRWRSDGRSGFTIEEMAEPAPRGTAVVLKLRDDAKEFLDGYRLRQIVRSYSDHIAVPILLLGEAAQDGKEAEDLKEAAAREPEQINEASALWTRPKADISDEQYKEFYHHVAHAFDDPWARLHVQAEGMVSYQALLFVPGTPPFDLYDPKGQHGVKLYVRRVFITGDLEGLMPRYLRFVKGVVDSEDLQLNVSRETLQHSPVLARIRRDLVKRVLDELDRRAKADEADYQKFWQSFGAVLKEGMYEDHEQRERLLELARFHSTAGDGLASLADYLGRMKAGQDAIFTISGENPDALKASPQLEACRAKGVEVLLLSDPIDEFWMPTTHDYKGKPFRSLTRGDVDLSKIESPDAPESAADETETGEVADDAMDRLIAVIKERLGDKVQDVRRSARLTESAVCLVAEEHGMDLRLERFLKQHQQLDQLSKRVLEINPKHALIREMARAADDGQHEALGDLAELLLDQARIVEGEPVPDPGAFSRRMSAFLTRGLAA
jgi:molecular chaperone HtpG